MSRYTVHRLDELLAATFPKQQFLLEPYIMRGGTTFMFGSKSLGKSPLAWSWACAIGEGKPWLGLPTVRGRTLIVETDQPIASIQPRVALLNHTSKNLWFFSGPPLEVPNVDMVTSKELAAARDYVEPDLVVFNTLRNTTLLPVEDGTTCRHVYGWARKTFPGCAFLFVHHPKKEPPGDVHVNMDEQFAGNNAWRNDAQVSLHLQRWDEKRSKSWKTTARLRHTGAQGSALYKPLPLLLDASGTNWSSPLWDELSVIREFKAGNPDLSGHALDKALMMAYPEIGKISTVRTRRKRAEAEGVEWLERVHGEAKVEAEAGEPEAEAETEALEAENEHE